MAAILIEKTIQLNKFDIVKYQIMHYCFMNKIRVGETELSCLALLGQYGPTQLTDFCQLVVNKKLLSHLIGVNNLLRRLQDKKLVIKQKEARKVVSLNPELMIQSEGNIVFNLKLIKLESKKVTGNISTNRTETQLA